jgi:hypothetical protein
MTVTEQRRYQILRPLLLAGSAAVFSMLLVSSAAAQLTLRGTANPTVSITTGTAGGSMTSVVNTSSQIRYTRQGVVCKITVRSTCPSQSFHLSVVATGVTRGVAAPAVDLTDGMLAVDFITNIPSTGIWLTSTPTLRYTASATFSDGDSAEMGNDVHTVTYTLQAQ